ncbi:NUDIX domain-containing protein [Haliangium sp.]|uniref:NUDIX domain-containing protein n=1 Tax=Haliangium sp. TaxID=2663208 RepID=UPI003D122C30
MSHPNPARAVVTAGQTCEPIPTTAGEVGVAPPSADAGLGVALARALARRGWQVELLVSPDIVAGDKLAAGSDLVAGVDLAAEGIAVERYATAAELGQAVERAVCHPDGPPAMLWMTAEVASYQPVPEPAAGSARADSADEVHVRLRRAPDLLAGMRARCGAGGFLVGCKRVWGREPEVAAAAARELVRAHGLDLCLAYAVGAASSGPAGSSVCVVTAEGGALALASDPSRSGTGADALADQIVELALTRRAVHRYRSAAVALPAPSTPGRALAGRLLDFARAAELLSDDTCSVSWRAEPSAGDGASGDEGDDDGLWISPRTSRSGELRARDLLRAWVDLDQRRVDYAAPARPVEPAADVGVHAWLYRAVPELQGFVHCRDALLVADAETEVAHPAGTREAAEEIHRALTRAARTGRWRGGPCVVHLRHHGYLLGLTRAALEAWSEAWVEAEQAYFAHLDEIGLAGARGVVSCAPVLAGGRVVGVFAAVPVSDEALAPSTDEERAALAAACARLPAGTRARSLFLLERERRTGLGDDLLMRLEARGDHIVIHDRCQVSDYYGERGYRELARAGALALLEPPSRRDDLTEAASVCLYHPLTREVLLGRRLVGAWPGHWSFPGGRVEPGESPGQAAVRELEEETGIHLRERSVDAETRTHVGFGPRAFAITNLRIAVLSRPAPTAGDELEACWVPLARALELRPMGAGTRRVLRALARELGVSGPA